MPVSGWARYSLEGKAPESPARRTVPRTHELIRVFQDMEPGRVTQDRIRAGRRNRV